MDETQGEPWGPSNPNPFFIINCFIHGKNTFKKVYMNETQGVPWGPSIPDQFFIQKKNIHKYVNDAFVKMIDKLQCLLLCWCLSSLIPGGRNGGRVPTSRSPRLKSASKSQGPPQHRAPAPLSCYKQFVISLVYVPKLN